MSKTVPLYTQYLMRWYKKNARDLPWRNVGDPYKIWISEIMLQQTTVSAVIPFYNKWVKRFPTVESVAKARETTVLKMWQGLGYYSRARNIQKSAKVIVKEYNSKIPQDANVLIKLPGFGSYTVGAVLSIAFDMREPIIDANVRRVIMRLLAQKGLADTSQDKDILKSLDKLLPYKDVSSFNQALMELGALVCRNKRPMCLQCPVRSLCKAYKLGKQDIIPETKKKIIKSIYAVVGLIQCNGKYFVQKRSKKGLLAGLWEFPGEGIERGASSLGVLKRSLKKAAGVSVVGAKRVMAVKHYYTQYCVHLSVFDCLYEGEPNIDDDHKWVDINRLDKFPMPSGSTKIVDNLIKKEINGDRC